MLPTQELINSLAVKPVLDTATLASVVDALSDCEKTVTACGAGMLAEQDIDQTRSSVRHDLNCGDVVVTTRRLLTRATSDDSILIAAQLEACLVACGRSHEACSQTAAAHDHCRMCAAATQRAADACSQALEALRG